MIFPGFDGTFGQISAIAKAVNGFPICIGFREAVINPIEEIDPLLKSAAGILKRRAHQCPRPLTCIAIPFPADARRLKPS
jgi:hypothetical protein